MVSSQKLSQCCLPFSAVGLRAPVYSTDSFLLSAGSVAGSLWKSTRRASLEYISARVPTRSNYELQIYMQTHMQAYIYAVPSTLSSN